MSDENGHMLLLATFVAAVAMVTWIEVKRNHTVPRPQRYVSAGLLWGILGISSPVLTYSLTGLFGVGILLTLMYTYFRPQATTTV
jgi:hypothetical protein